VADPIHFDGGSDDDRRAVLAAHDAYLHANAVFDWPALKPIWSDDPTSTTASTRKAAGGSRST